MVPLPAPLGESGPLVAWRLCETRFRATWDDGEGSFRYGGRWSSERVRAVYCSLDPATAILEMAVHMGFDALDSVPYTLTRFEIADTTLVHVVQPASVAHQSWLGPGPPSEGQQRFGDDLLRSHRFILIPSAASPHSWNLVFDSTVAMGTYGGIVQERFALDTRLNPPRRPTTSRRSARSRRATRPA